MNSKMFFHIVKEIAMNRTALMDVFEKFRLRSKYYADQYLRLGYAQSFEILLKSADLYETLTANEIRPRTYTEIHIYQNILSNLLLLKEWELDRIIIKTSSSHNTKSQNLQRFIQKFVLHVLKVQHSQVIEGDARYDVLFEITQILKLSTPQEKQYAAIIDLYK